MAAGSDGSTREPGQIRKAQRGGYGGVGEGLGFPNEGTVGMEDNTESNTDS